MYGRCTRSRYPLVLNLSAASVVKERFISSSSVSSRISIFSEKLLSPTFCPIFSFPLVLIPNINSMTNNNLTTTTISCSTKELAGRYLQHFQLIETTDVLISFESSYQLNVSAIVHRRDPLVNFLVPGEKNLWVQSYFSTVTVSEDFGKTCLKGFNEGLFFFRQLNSIFIFAPSFEGQMFSKSCFFATAMFIRSALRLS